MRKEIRDRLNKMSDADYVKFSASLIPASGRGTMLGVRLPALRDYAKELSKGDWRQELSYEEDLYFEETMLRGMILGYACRDIEELFACLKDFIPRVQNWSVCDSVCSGLKLVEKYPEKTWDFLQPYLKSGEEFPCRVGLIMLLNHFVKLGEDKKKITRKRSVTMADLQGQEETGGYLEPILQALDREFTEGYYAQMAAAWLLAELFVTYPVRTLRGLRELHLDAFTRKKAVQKIRESRIPDKEVKAYLREMYPGR
ncbi:MAG: DNA alkylation repair protein [Lachnospiraceae bacterium]|jgi:3-methyladenine DNA glycosylase AlkD|nr:DNA alkylation repair protein [Lachnospiraceae bacterium]MCI9599662.1 DNA alkylation repair protein [Lachnospiraceae bacterium]MDE6896804.1 DNA alkylation repair protein [Lachnospiraceae bacterium]